MHHRFDLKFAIRVHAMEKDESQRMMSRSSARLTKETRRAESNTEPLSVGKALDTFHPSVRVSRSPDSIETSVGKLRCCYQELLFRLSLATLAPSCDFCRFFRLPDCGVPKEESKLRGHCTPTGTTECQFDDARKQNIPADGVVRQDRQRPCSEDRASVGRVCKNWRRE
jgi:hypothetical protein